MKGSWRRNRRKIWSTLLTCKVNYPAGRWEAEHELDILYGKMSLPQMILRFLYETKISLLNVIHFLESRLDSFTKNVFDEKSNKSLFFCLMTFFEGCKKYLLMLTEWFFDASYVFHLHRLDCMPEKIFPYIEVYQDDIQTSILVNGNNTLMTILTRMLIKSIFLNFWMNLTFLASHFVCLGLAR